MSNGLHLKYFVLNPSSSDKPFAIACQKALATFSKEISKTNEELSIDIDQWLLAIKKKENDK